MKIEVTCDINHYFIEQLVKYTIFKIIAINEFVFNFHVTFLIKKNEKIH